MTRIHIPTNAWMKYRKQGRTLFAQKKGVIIWRTTPPPSGTELYVVAWANSQQSLLASEIVRQP